MGEGTLNLLMVSELRMIWVTPELCTVVIVVSLSSLGPWMKGNFFLDTLRPIISEIIIQLYSLMYTGSGHQNTRNINLNKAV